MQRRIPCLDGLRAVGLAFVIATHAMHTADHARFWVESMGATALSMFFFISGYLITGVLLDSQTKRGAIDLRGYYVRRFFRIVPALYVFLAVLAAANLVDWRSLFAVASFNVASWQNTSGFVGHTWTLSVEEQFYVFWPLVLVVTGPKRAMKVALLLIALAPILRVGQYALFPQARWMAERALHTRIDSLMSGCLIALWAATPEFERKAKRILTAGWALAAGSFLVVVSPALSFFFGARYRLPFGLSLETLAIAVVVMYLVREPGVAVGRFLNWRPVVHLGLISYSVYLWQEIFLTEPSATVFGPAWDGVLRRFPINVIAALVVGELSYRTVEAWSLRTRKKFERRRTPSLATAAGD